MKLHESLTKAVTWRPEWLAYRIKLRELQSGQWAIERDYDDAIRMARHEGKPQDDIETLISERFMETDMADEEVYFLVTQRLRQICHRLFLPFPAHGTKDIWEKGNAYGRWHLNEAGIAQVRAAIRKERKEKSEVGLAWLAGATGVIGALTGLLAVFFSK